MTSKTDRQEAPPTMHESVDVAVVGAGFSGLHLLYELRSRGYSVRVLEAGDGVGGTWYWNRYPGARCDVESWDYSFSFDPDLQREWDWSERFATQAEILSYLEHVADRFDLRRDIRFSTRVSRAAFVEESGRWAVESQDGYRVDARFIMFATGNLSAAQVPEFPGADEFLGTQYHTGQWPHDGVDMRGRRVAIIGTGSSGVQAIPRIAEEAAHVTVLQRTPTFTVPARNRAVDESERAAVKARYAERRRFAMTHPGGLPIVRGHRSAHEVSDEERDAEFERRWQMGGPGLPAAFTDVAVDPDANELLAEFVRRKIDEAVEDPEVADRLKPRGIPFGAKRPCLDTGYYETFNRSNVNLVDVNESKIVRIVQDGVLTTDGLVEADTIVYATGYDAMTGALNRIDIRGRHGEALRDKWSAGPLTYLGLGTAGFPNMFIIAGPGSPAVLGNVIVTVEQHVHWVSDLLDRMSSQGHQFVQVDPQAEIAWVQHVNELAEQTLFMRANSWYLGANIEGKPRVFMPYPGGVPRYQQVCRRVEQNDYPGFTFARGVDEEQHATSPSTLTELFAPAPALDPPEHRGQSSS